MATNPAFVPDLATDPDIPKKDLEYGYNSGDATAITTTTTTTTIAPTTATTKSHSFNDAISLTGVGKFHVFVLCICGLGFTAVMTEIVSVGFILPEIKCDFRSTTTEQGILASSAFIGIVLGSQVVGFLADTWGRVKTLRYCFILGALSTIVSAFSVNTWMLIAFRFLNGLFISGGQACVFTICGEFHSNTTRVKHMTWLSGFSPLSLILMPVFAIIIFPLDIESEVFGMRFSPWRIFLLVNSSISFIAAGGLFCLPETPRYVLVQGDNEGALQIMQDMYARNMGRPASEFPVHSIDLEIVGNSIGNVRSLKDGLKMLWSQTAPLFYRERCMNTINICGIMFMLYVVAQGIFVWFPTIFGELLANIDRGDTVCQILNGMDTAEDIEVVCARDVNITTYLMLLVVGIAFTLFYVVCGYIINYIGKKNLIMIWVGLVALSLLGLHWIVGIGLAGIAIGLPASVGYCGSIVNTISMEYFPTNINAGALSLNMMVGRLGAAIGSNLIAQLLFQQCDLVFWVLMALMCAVIVMAFFLPERKRK